MRTFYHKNRGCKEPVEGIEPSHYRQATTTSYRLINQMLPKTVIILFFKKPCSDETKIGQANKLETLNPFPRNVNLLVVLVKFYVRQIDLIDFSTLVLQPVYVLHTNLELAVFFSDLRFRKHKVSL